jgi:putative methionine-R-sulfoxide reductase with GAF domain
MNDILDILINFGGGKGGEVSGTVVRFLLPTYFWVVLSYVSGEEYRRKDNRRDLYIALAALLGAARELLMFLAEYGSGRGYFNFDVFYRFYPPLEHAITILVGIFISYAFMRYGGEICKRCQNRFLVISLSLTLTLYLATAIGWPIYLLSHPKISFGLYWGDLAFRLVASLILGTALVRFIMAKMQRNNVSIPLMSGISFFLLDELLMIINIATAERYVSIFAPIRHNLHIWAVPFFIATYWSELKYQSKIYEGELEEQHHNMANSNISLEKRIADAVGELERRDWFNSGLNQLNALLRGDQSLQEMANKTLSFLVKYVGASVGVFYSSTESEGALEVIATHAVMGESRLNRRIAAGEGLAGQVAISRTTIRLFPVPPEYLPIGSALGESTPLEIIVLPVLHNENLAAVIELGSFTHFSTDHTEFLRQAAEVIGLATSVIHSHQLLNELLEQTQSQAEELRVQQEELQQTNEELSERALMLAERGRR